MIRKVIVVFIVVLLSLSFGCRSDLDYKKLRKINPDISTVIKGEIINRDVYPNTKTITLTIPDFIGHKNEITVPIDSTGHFRFEFFPIVTREIHLNPIEKTLVVSPGDSVYLIKDFKRLNFTRFRGDNRNLNMNISRFYRKYSGRYQIDLYNGTEDFKVVLSGLRKKYLDYLERYCERYEVSDQFKRWCTKQINLDYSYRLIEYSLKRLHKSSVNIFRFFQHINLMNEVNNCIDEEILMSGYFNVLDIMTHYEMSLLGYKYSHFYRDNPQIPALVVQDLFESTSDSFVAQLFLCNFINYPPPNYRMKFYEEHKEYIESHVKDEYLTYYLIEFNMHTNNMDEQELILNK